MMDVTQKEAAHRAASDAELICWVDEHDNLLRALSKALYPGFWDTAAGGMVADGESYADSAARELEEELGVGGVELVEHDHFYFEDGDSRLWCKSYAAVWDGELSLQPEEVMEARFLPLEIVLQEAEQKPYCPDAQEGLRRYLASRR